MNPQDVVYEFLSIFEREGTSAAKHLLADDFIVTVEGQPGENNKAEFIGQGNAMQAAMPDFQWGIQDMETQGNQVMVRMQWSGTHTGTLDLGAFGPNLPTIPATNLNVSVRDRFLFTVRGDQISRLEIVSGVGEGFPEFMRQLGMQMPPQ